jgi:hypothetical protein
MGLNARSFLWDGCILSLILVGVNSEGSSKNQMAWPGRKIHTVLGRENV